MHCVSRVALHDLQSSQATAGAEGVNTSLTKSPEKNYVDVPLAFTIDVSYDAGSVCGSRAWISQWSWRERLDKPLDLCESAEYVCPGNSTSHKLYVGWIITLLHSYQLVDP